MATGDKLVTFDMAKELHDKVDGDLEELKSAIDTVKDEALAAFPESSAGPADMLTVTDGADNIPLKTLSVAIEPKQDLHGYDKPWVGGAGKNLASPVTDSNGWSINVGGSFSVNGDILAVEITAAVSSGVYAKSGSTLRNILTSLSGQYTWSIDVKASASISAAIGVQGIAMRNHVTVGTSWTRISGTGTFTATSVPFVIYNNGSTAATIEARNLQIEAGSTATDYAPYSNICPIEGYDSVDVVRIGKNLFPSEGVWQNGSINTSGNNFSSDYGIRTADYLKIAPNTAYTFSALGMSDDCAVFCFDKNYNLLNRFQLWSINSTNRNSASFTTPVGTFYYRVRLTGSDYRPDRAMGFQLELGSSATAYEPYNSQSVSVNVKSVNNNATVYGGTVTVNEDGSGTLVVDRAKVTLTGNESLAYSATTKSFYHDAADTVPGIAGKEYTIAFDGTCDRFAPYDGVTAWANLTTACVGYVNAASPRLRFSIPGETEVTESVRAKLAGTEVAYKLATPQTYPLTATQLRTLLGNNTLWCDAGQVSMTYRQDTGTVIDSSVQDLRDNTLSLTSWYKNMPRTAGSVTINGLTFTLQTYEPDHIVLKVSGTATEDTSIKLDRNPVEIYTSSDRYKKGIPVINGHKYSITADVYSTTVPIESRSIMFGIGMSNQPIESFITGEGAESDYLMPHMLFKSGYTFNCNIWISIFDSSQFGYALEHIIKRIIALET